MKRWLVVVGLLTVTLGLGHAAPPPQYAEQGTVIVAPNTAQLTAVDPLVYAEPSDVVPPRPFLYTVDANGITITRFNDNRVVGTWPWPKAPELIYTVTPDGSFTGLTPPAAWEPVAMVVSYPTVTEWGNRGMTGTTVLKPIPDLTPPFTKVYVVMAHSGYAWHSSDGRFRDTIIADPNPATDSSMLIQIDVSDPSFSTAFDASAPVEPHMAAALLGHGAGQPVYNPADGTVYVGNMPSTTLPANLASFVSVIGRIPDTVASSEREVPGINIPVIRCGPQHPEAGIPVGRPQAYACYDPSGLHPINDNEHVGAAGDFDWEFRNLPDWLHVGNELAPDPSRPGVHMSKDGILYGTPPVTGEWYAEARVHNLDDDYGAWSYWSPVRLLVTPTAEYLPIRAQFASGVPVAYQLEGTGACTLSGAPSWVSVVPVPNGCVIMGKAPLDGEYYNFAMPGFNVTGYPGLSLVFSGNVFGQYGFVPLPNGVALSGLAFHQVSKVADPSTETGVLSIEFIGVQPSSGQLYRILAPPGKPQPPNERPPETALTIDVVTTMGAPLTGAGFGEVAVEADRDIYVAAGNQVIKVSGGVATPIALPDGMQASSLSLDSDLRTAIAGLEPGQVDHGALFVAGAGNVAVIDTDFAQVAQSFAVPDAGSVSVDFGTRYAYVAAGSHVATFGPAGSIRPPMRPRIWSYEEASYNQGFPNLGPQPFRMMATGDASLSLVGALPDGLTFTDLGGGIAELTGTPTVAGEFGLTLLATGPSGSYAQAFGVTVYGPPAITSGNTATFVAGASSSFMVTVDPVSCVIYSWDQALLPPGVQLIDNENGTASLIGIPQTPGTYNFRIGATTGYPVDAEQPFTLTVLAAGTQMPPVINSPETATWEAAGAPFGPDPFTVSSIGSPTPALTVSGTLPPGVTFVDNHDGTGTMGGDCRINWPGWAAECLGFLPDNAVGRYPLTITATNSVGTATQAFTLIVERNSTLLEVMPPPALSFTTDGSFAPTFTVPLGTGPGGDPLPYAIVTTASWITATPLSGITPTTLTVTLNPAGLAPGTYTGTVLVTSAGTEGPPATVMVTLTVTEAPAPGMMLLSPAMLTFASNGDTAPGEQNVIVAFGGSAMPFWATSSAEWLAATPASGTTPGNLGVSVNGAGLSAGIYTGTLTINTPGAVNNPQTVLVRMVKTDLAGDIRVMLNVGSGPEGLTVNQKTHQLFINSSNEAPAPPESESGAETEVPEPVDPNAGYAVFHVDPRGLKVVRSTLTHDEGEYIAVNSRTGRVYSASEGTGEVAVIDGNTDKVLDYVPLYMPEGVYVPYQIAIDEAQNLIYVGGHAPAIPDPIFRPGQPFACKAVHEMPDDEYDCWNPGKVFVIDGKTNQVVGSFLAGDDPEGVVFAAYNRKVYASNEDDGSVTIAKGAIRNADGSITPPTVLSTIIRGVAVPGWWQPTCDANNYCGERGQAALWPQLSACNGIDDEAEEADKMTVDPAGNVYIIDDRYRVAKIDAKTGSVVKVLDIPGFDCEVDVPDGSDVLLRNSANNIAFSAGDAKDPSTWRLYVTSEQETLSLINPVAMTLTSIFAIPGAVELDAIVTDASVNRIYISDEDLGALWVIKTGCGDGTEPCAPAFVQVASATPQTPKSTVTVKFKNPEWAGNLNIVVVGWNDATSNVTSVTDSAGNVYKLAIGPTRGVALSQSIYYASNIAGGADTVTVTFNQKVPFADIRILEYENVSTLDVTAGAAGLDALPDSGPAITTAANELIFGASTIRWATLAAGSGFTKRIITNPDSDLAEDLIGTAIGTYSATATNVKAGPWVMQMATFKR